ncbi:MAG TPA: LytTR family DNA-binding domain-containing protein [Chitinophagaceae bacterium]|nr:LytTR family DNA-binding domain-containing protein [Chitinophagaceae bacterium]
MTNTKKIRCLVIDDEPPAQVVLKKYIGQVERLELAGTCNSAVEAISFLQTEPVDLLFLDIQMPGLLGTKFVRTLNNPPKVIFTTAYRKFAVEGFELNVVDYLLKPISFERFLTGVNKIFQLNLQPASGKRQVPETDPESNHPFLYLRSDRKMVKVLFNDILYVESLKDYIKIVTVNKTIITRQSISSLEQMLPKDAFLRIHRSYIVAMNRIDSFNGEKIDIAKNELPIGRLFKHDVNLQLNK